MKNDTPPGYYDVIIQPCFHLTGSNAYGCPASSQISWYVHVNAAATISAWADHSTMKLGGANNIHFSYSDYFRTTKLKVNKYSNVYNQYVSFADYTQATNNPWNFNPNSADGYSPGSYRIDISASNNNSIATYSLYITVEDAPTVSISKQQATGRIHSMQMHFFLVNW